MGHVLVVDDSRTVRELHRKALETAGYRVATAVDGLDALAQLTSDGSIELVVTDLNMDSMDGLMLTEAIRARASVRGLPIVVVTSNESRTERRRIMEAGANAYIVKQGFSWQLLLRTVERLLGDPRLGPASMVI
jgi:two-component system chemotaxis sensor kinase CheA